MEGGVLMPLKYRRPSVKIGGTTIRKNKNGYSISGKTLLGGRRTYNTATGKTTKTYKTGIKGLSYQTVTGGKKSSDKKSKNGCYVATSVYGSYDCPQVWTLRRFRDDTLAKSVCGRLFIRTYYTISPVIVTLFGNSSWFKKMWRPILDKMVIKLNENGVKSEPYRDKEW